MSLWTQLDAILTLPLGAVMFGLLCVSLSTAIVALIGWRVAIGDVREANEGWRLCYGAWQRLEGICRCWDLLPDEEPVSEEEHTLH
jgi:hypothetical protein